MFLPRLGDNLNKVTEAILWLEDAAHHNPHAGLDNPQKIRTQYVVLKNSWE